MLTRMLMPETTQIIAVSSKSGPLDRVDERLEQLVNHGDRQDGLPLVAFVDAVLDRGGDHRRHAEQDRRHLALLHRQRFGIFGLLLFLQQLRFSDLPGLPLLLRHVLRALNLLLAKRLLVERLGVVFHEVEAFHVDEHGPVVGRAARREDADDDELAGVHVAAGLAVGRIDAVAELDVHLAGDRRADDRLEEAVLLALPLEVAALGELELAVVLDVIDQIVEQRGRGADDAEAAEIIAQANGNRQFGELAVFAVAAELHRRGLRFLHVRHQRFRRAAGGQRLDQAGDARVVGQSQKLQRIANRSGWPWHRTIPSAACRALRA